MRLKPLALGGAAIVALSGMIGASSAQTNSNAQSPYANAPATTTAAPANSNNSGDATQQSTPVAHHAIRHRAHRQQQASKSTPAEKAQTADLNNEQLVKVEAQASTNTQGTQAAANTTPAGNQTAMMEPQNAGGAQNAAPATTAQSGATSPSTGDQTSGQAASSTQQTQAANTAPAGNQTAMTASQNAGGTQNAAPATTAQSAGTGPSTGDQTSGQAAKQTTAQNDATVAQPAASAQPKASTTVALDTVQNPKQALSSATVKNSSGQPIGQVKKVVVGSDGKPQTIHVTLQGANGGSSKTVAVDANMLSYDPNDKALITPLSTQEINSLPAAPAASPM